MKSRAPMTDDPPEKLNKVEATTNDAAATGGGDTPAIPSRDPPTVNEAQEMVCRLFNQSKILDKC